MKRKEMKSYDFKSVAVKIVARIVIFYMKLLNQTRITKELAFAHNPMNI